MSNIDQIQQYQKYMLYYVAAHIPVYTIVDFVFGLHILAPLLLQTILAALGFLAVSLYKTNKKLSFDFSSISIALTPAVLVYMLEGQKWQLDAHMYFFAVMAMIVGFKSLRAAIIAAAAIAVHHLSLNFLMPYVLYPTGADFFRVIFHAVIVIVETGVILFIIQNLLKNDKIIQEETEIARQALQEANKAKERQEEAEKQSKEERRQAVHDITVNFDSQVGGLIQSLTSSSAELQKTAEAMLSIADQTSSDGENVAKSSTEASSNVQTVASAMEEMSSTASEISRQIHDVKTKSSDTADNAESANATVSNLNQLAENIGEVVTSIRDIAEQTNLLALNATIEAARAGEAGKGFAVVADEVKKLASETSQKTEEIDSRVTAIQDATKDSVIAMQRIISNISEIDGSVTNVSAAVEEQNAATAEIVRSVAEASQSVKVVSEIIMNVQKSAKETGQSSNMVLTSASEVAKLSGNLKTSVDHFLEEIAR